MSKKEITIKLTELQSMILIKGLASYMLYGNPNKEEREIIVNALRRVEQGIPIKFNAEVE